MSLPVNHIPTAELVELFPDIATAAPLEVHGGFFAFRAHEMPLLLPHEQLVLAALVRHLKPRRLVEFGTAHGQGTYALAANSPAEAEVYTIDLARLDDYGVKCMRGDPDLGRCLRGVPQAAKVRQVLRQHAGDLAEPLPGLRGTCDFLFIDGDHGYEGVRTDTLTALELAGDGAVLLWHDFYAFPSYVAEPREKRGVFPWLNELAAERRLVMRHILGTFMVVARIGWREPLPGVLMQPGDVAGPFGDHNVRLIEAGGTAPDVGR